MWFNAFLFTTIITLLFTRASIIRHVVHRVLLQLNPNLDELLRCAMCIGFWISIIVALILHISLAEWCIVYLGMLIFIALYDFLSRTPSNLE